MEIDEIIYKKVKRLTLRMQWDGRLTVTAPQNSSEQQIAAFVQTHQNWINRHRQRLLERQQVIRQVRLVNDYQEQGRIAYLGQYYPLRQQPGGKGFLWDSEQLFLSGCDTVEQRRQAVEKFYRQQAQQVFGELSMVVAQQLQRNPAEIVIRKMRASWGRCYSGQNRIVLNLRLIQAPLECIQAVVTHEYVHFQQPNHAAIFYHQLEQLLPNYHQLTERLSLMVEIRGEME